MVTTESFIGIEAIRNWYKDEIEEEKKEYSEDELTSFVEFLEVDFYDWLRSNYNHFKS